MYISEENAAAIQKKKPSRKIFRILERIAVELLNKNLQMNINKNHGKLSDEISCKHSWKNPKITVTVTENMSK